MSMALVAGEVLFDIFEDGSHILGGAPFNVAWHLHGLGLNPLLVSAVGDDMYGDQIRKSMQAWGMNTEAVQTIQRYPTGTVQVGLQNGSPSFDIVKDVAYDFIEKPEKFENRINTCKLMYHGSLALRSATSKQTIMGLRKESCLPVFVDVNLRAPYWDKNSIEEIINGADWVKLNDEELQLLSNKNSKDFDQSELVVNAQSFRKQHDIKVVIITRGKEGAFVVAENVIEHVQAAPVVEMVDTVGAGDGFSAMTIAGILQGWDYIKTLEAASLFASKICGLRGATSKDRAFYDDFMDEID